MVFIVIGFLACNAWYALPVLKERRGGVTESRKPNVDTGREERR
jgi:hypothetical protein